LSGAVPISTRSAGDSDHVGVLLSSAAGTVNTAVDNLSNLAGFTDAAISEDDGIA
jgi:hypothetical protein